MIVFIEEEQVLSSSISTHAPPFSCSSHCDGQYNIDDSITTHLQVQLPPLCIIALAVYSELVRVQHESDRRTGETGVIPKRQWNGGNWVTHYT